MEKLVSELEKLAHNVGDDWKETAMMENPEKNILIDAYNEGVKKMAKFVCQMIKLKAETFALMEECKKDGTKITIEKAGVQ